MGQDPLNRSYSRERSFSMDIAVILDELGKTSVFEKDGVLKVFSKESGTWKTLRERIYRITQTGSADAMRRYLSELGDWLGDCRNLVAKRMRGTHLAAFEKHQLTFWEIDGYPDQFLDSIQETQCQCAEQPSESLGAIIAPLEPAPGFLRIDLREVMSRRISFNSRQALEPFLSKRCFSQLEIECLHEPRWLADALLKYHLISEKKEISDGTVHILVHPAPHPSG
jgi:Fe-only nitrogenase accessory protein AnfO